MLAPPPRELKGSHVRALDNAPNWNTIETVGELGRTHTQSYTIFPNWVSPLSNYFVPPLIFWPTSLTTTRLELITMAPDWGDGEAPDLWTVSDEKSPNGRAMAQLILEDTQFGEAIQRSMESRGFQSVPLSYQESRIYWFHQNCDRMIGIEKIPAALRSNRSSARIGSPPTTRVWECCRLTIAPATGKLRNRSDLAHDGRHCVVASAAPCATRAKPSRHPEGICATGQTRSRARLGRNEAVLSVVFPKTEPQTTAITNESHIYPIAIDRPYQYASF